MKEKLLLLMVVFVAPFTINGQISKVVKHLTGSVLLADDERKVMLLHSDTLSLTTSYKVFIERYTEFISKNNSESDKNLLKLFTSDTSQLICSDSLKLTETEKAILALRIADILESGQCFLGNNKTRKVEREVVIERYATQFVRGRRFKTKGEVLIIETVDTTDSYGRLTPMQSEDKTIKEAAGRMAVLDALLMSKHAKVILFAYDNKVLDRKGPLKIETGSTIPDSVEYISQILVNNDQAVLAIVKTYYYDTTQSNMRSRYFKQYFDKEGNTFAVERKSCFINSKCHSGLLCSFSREYYAEGLRLIYLEQQLSDELGNNFAFEGCWSAKSDYNSIMPNSKDQLLWDGIAY